MEFHVRAALYARVSSDRQEREETIQSQLEELRTRIRSDGIIEWTEFTDEGYSRDNLVRPDLDRLRDMVNRAELDVLYVSAADRLASGGRLMLLYEELQEHGVQVICDPKSLLYLEGTQVDFKDEVMGRGFVFTNPNATSSCGCGSSFSV